MSRMLAAIWCLLVLTAETSAVAGEPQAIEFGRDVRPILKANCFHCHGEEKDPEAGLDLRLQRFLIRGGESGSAIVPGKPEESLLMERIEAGEMPPEDVEKKLTADEVSLIRRWVESGARVAEEEPETLAHGLHISSQDRRFWAFQPVRRPEPPSVQKRAQARTPVDQFILARLAENGLSLSAEADRMALLRRAHFGLIGLPPTPDATAEFLHDTRPGAYERMIDRLLASPHYGERWGRHWLDVAGYADSEGYTDSDTERPHAYKYRDYVIRAMNGDKPFDQFVVEQLAGDELIGWPRDELSEVDADRLTATGFLRTAPDGTGVGGVDQSLARNEVVAKTLEIVSSSLLGLTVACAQCHNHRYDPISQEDYYRFRAIFEPAYNWKDWLTPQQRRVSLYREEDRKQAAEIEQQAKRLDAERTRQQQVYIDQVLERELAKLPDAIREKVRAASSTREKERTDQQRQLLRQHPSVNVSAGSLYLYDRKASDHLKKMAADAAKLRATKPKEDFIRALWEPADRTPPETFVFFRGDFQQPAGAASPSELSVLRVDAAIQVDDPQLRTTGRRLAYARWLTNGRHPLLARVIANRIWMHHFGRGLVATPSDFGFLGARPSHPALLDWLADELVRSGWSLKRLHRLIMTSTVYRQTSQPTAEGMARDAGNRLLWRMPLRRMEAEVIRDSMLALGDHFNRRQFGPAVPVMADRVGQFVVGKENLNAGRPGPVIPMKGEQWRRSIYVQVRRSRPLSVLEAFDLPRMAPNCSARVSSTVATQSLLMMNSPSIHQFADQLAGRIRRETGEARERQVIRAYQLALSRRPSDEELAEAIDFLDAQTAALRKGAATGKAATAADAAADAALASFCHAILSSNAFLYVD